MFCEGTPVSLFFWLERRNLDDQILHLLFRCRGSVRNISIERDVLGYGHIALASKSLFLIKIERELRAKGEIDWLFRTGRPEIEIDILHVAGKNTQDDKNSVQKNLQGCSLIRTRVCRPVDYCFSTEYFQQ